MKYWNNKKKHTLVNVNKAKLNRSSLALLWYESRIEILEHGLYCSANRTLKSLSLTKLFRKCTRRATGELNNLNNGKSNLQNFVHDLIAVQIELLKLWAWPYCDANLFRKFSSLALFTINLTSVLISMETEPLAI